jgi:hypothetical protein
MSPAYLALLSGVVVAIISSRVLFKGIPLPLGSSPLSVLDAIALSGGVVGLVLHCGAMFFRSWFRSIPGGHVVIRIVDPLGTSSILWFAIAAALVLVGLRRQLVVVLALVAGSLAAVGVTMYDGGSLRAHLTAIFVSVVLLAAVGRILAVPQSSKASPTGDVSMPT